VRLMLPLILEQERFEVVVAASVTEALEINFYLHPLD
jgi:hypothetical protein